MQGLLDDKDRQTALLKTQKFALEESNQALEDSLREAQGKIGTLLRELANRNNFIKENLQRKQSLSQSGNE